MLILGAVEQKLGMAMQNEKISTLCMETEHSMHTWYLRREGKSFQNFCLCQEIMKPHPPSNWSGLAIALSSIVKTTSRCCSPIHEALLLPI